LLDAILISSSDHGPGAPSAATARLACSGNRSSVSSSIAAGILAIGDEHGGAGMACMEMIAAGLNLAQSESISIEEAAGRIADDAKARKIRLPGLGHRSHTEDPRKDVLFGMAREYGLARDGVTLMLALEKAASQKIKKLPMNVDGVLAAVLHDLGFSHVFGSSRAKRPCASTSRSSTMVLHQEKFLKQRVYFTGETNGKARHLR
jgi:citrate synthase